MNSNSRLIAELRKRAIETLQESTEMFEQSFSLLRGGNLEEAEKMQGLAREKRTESALLMHEASRFENEAQNHAAGFGARE